MRRFCYIILFVFIAISCGSARKATTSQEVVSTVVSTVDSTALRKEIESIVQERLDVALALEHAEQLEILQERFSKPDSCGNTYLEEKVVTRYNATSKAQSMQIGAKDSTVVSKSIADTLSKAAVAAIDTHQDEIVPQEQKSVPGIIRTFAWVGVAAVLALVFGILIKLKVI